MRGDDRPGMKKTEAAKPGRPGERGRLGDDRRESRRDNRRDGREGPGSRDGRRPLRDIYLRKTQKLNIKNNM